MYFWEKAHQDKLYKNWTEVEEKLPYLLKAIELIKSTTPTALDVGCSIGNYSSVLVKNGFQVKGIDISPEAIRLAKERVDAEFVVADARQFSSGSYDFILDYSCFTHLEEKYRQSYIKNIKQMLNPQGIYLNSVWSKNSTRAYDINPSKESKSGFTKKTDKGEFYNYFFTKEELREIFSDFTIHTIQEERLNSFRKIQPDSDLKLYFVTASLE